MGAGAEAEALAQEREQTNVEKREESLSFPILMLYENEEEKVPLHDSSSKVPLAHIFCTGARALSSYVTPNR